MTTSFTIPFIVKLLEDSCNEDCEVMQRNLLNKGAYSDHVLVTFRDGEGKYWKFKAWKSREIKYNTRLNKSNWWFDRLPVKLKQVKLKFSVSKENEEIIPYFIRLVSQPEK